MRPPGPVMNPAYRYALPPPLSKVRVYPLFMTTECRSCFFGNTLFIDDLGLRSNSFDRISQPCVGNLMRREQDFETHAQGGIMAALAIEKLPSLLNAHG